jgi:hypothetical protein
MLPTMTPQAAAISGIVPRLSVGGRSSGVAVLIAGWPCSKVSKGPGKGFHVAKRALGNEL